MVRKGSAARTSANALPKTRAGRPTKKRVEAIQATILATALEMFLDAGYSVTSMDAIAARARISKGTLYARYSNKAELFTAIVEDRVTAWSKAASLHDAELPPDLTGRLRHHVRVSLQSMADPEISAFAELIAAERKRFPELARIYHERAVAYEIDMLAADIASAADREGIRINDPAAAAAALLQMGLGWSSLRALSGEPMTADVLDSAAERIVALLIQGLAAW
jgi:TetR/AcrR family transcriptional regulator, mexJK operon transcriptional repressor